MTKWMVFLTAIALVILSCSPSANPTVSVAEMGVLAASLEAASDTESVSILAAKGWDEERFRLAVEEIMEDPDKAAVFTRAYKKAVKG